MKFKYVARDMKGQRISDVIVADNVASVIVRLKKDGLLPVKVNEVRSSTGQFARAVTQLKSGVKGKELAVFTRQLAATLSAGLLLTEALETIAEDLENEHFQGVIHKIIDDIRGGNHFSIALAKHPKIFPSTYISIIKSGEATGNLDRTLTSLARYLESSERLKEKVRTAIAYPSFVFGFAFFVVMVIVVFLIPKFKTLYDSAKSQLPLLTRIVVGISDFVLQHFVLGIVACVLLIIAFIWALKLPRFQYMVDEWKFKIPVLGKDIIQKAVIARFCRTMSVLLTGGVGMTSALEIVEEVVNHLPLKRAVERIRFRVMGGGTMSTEIRSQKIFPRLVSKMTSVGERTGRVDDMLSRTADYYEEELEATLQKLTAILEPALIIFVGSVVLVVVLALYLPIFKLSSTIR